MIAAFPLIILTAILNTAAQLLLKIGMDNIGEFSFTAANTLPIALKVITSPFIIIGMVVYVVSVTLWLLVLSRVPVGIAYPMTSLAYIFSAIAAYYLLGEHLSYLQVIGIFIIIFGVYLIAQH
jgi:drug/metabolite transporter (DMT)-like permease